MSRIGKKPITIPEGVKIDIDKQGFKVVVTGPKGVLDMKFSPEVEVEIKENELIVSKVGRTKNAPAFWGTTVRLIDNMIKGVVEGYQKELELNGVGFRMAVKGNKIDLALGFSHPVEVAIPEGIRVEIKGNVMTIIGIDKQAVGQFAANVRSLKPVEPYKGKGFKYVGEHVRRKEGKKAGSA